VTPGNRCACRHYWKTRKISALIKSWSAIPVLPGRAARGEGVDWADSANAIDESGVSRGFRAASCQSFPLATDRSAA
jgi:hypothetical protein